MDFFNLVKQAQSVGFDVVQEQGDWWAIAKGWKRGPYRSYRNAWVQSGVFERTRKIQLAGILAIIATPRPKAKRRTRKPKRSQAKKAIENARSSK